jgi:hypothetical protein
MPKPIKILVERLFELDKKLYLITISVEGVEQEGNNRFEVWSWINCGN